MPRLTAEVWMTIRAEREAVGVSLRVLAKRHGVDHAAIVRRAKREGWQCGTARADVESRTREIVGHAERPHPALLLTAKFLDTDRNLRKMGSRAFDS